MNKEFYGPLAASIQRHLQLRHALGFSYENATYTLADFDRYLAQYFPQTITVTRPIVVAYLETTRHLAPRTECASAL